MWATARSRLKARYAILCAALLLVVGLLLTARQQVISKSVSSREDVPSKTDSARKKALPALSDVERAKSIARSCGDLCNPEVQTTVFVPKLNSSYRKVQVTTDRCRALYSNGYMFASAGLSEAPRQIPRELVMNFTMNNRVPRREFYKNNVYLGNVTRRLTWTPASIAEDTEKLSRGLLYGTYGYAATKDVLALLRHINVRGARVLVVGSERPWVEVVALAAGARETVTLEFSDIDAQDPRMSAFTPQKFSEAYLSGRLKPFDIVVSFSSFEHSGLGRYGDALNPWGDVVGLAMAWCVARPSAKLVLEVPRATSDVLLFNAHRFYGPIRLPFLTTNWAQLVPDEAWGSKLLRIGDLARPIAYKRME